MQAANLTVAPPVNLEDIKANKKAYFAELRRQLNPGPTLRDLETWRKIRRNERKYLLALAGFSKLGRHGGKGQSDIDLYSSLGWDKLPDHARSRLKVAIARLHQTLAEFGGPDQ
jgi:hypothetical protein